jgi:hypothetical protein
VPGWSPPVPPPPPEDALVELELTAWLDELAVVCELVVMPLPPVPVVVVPPPQAIHGRAAPRTTAEKIQERVLIFREIPGRGIRE